MPYATSGSCRIYYESHGAGRTVALIHGAGGNHAVWWKQVSRLRKSCRVITIDLRGFGCSDTVAEGPDASDFPDDIRAVLADAGASEVALLGQSIGAVAALRCAVLSPELIKGVVLANSVGGLNHPELNTLVKADRGRAEKLTVIDRLLTRSFQEQQPEQTFLFQQVGSFNRAKMQDIRNVSAPGPTVDAVRAAGIRVLFMSGELDPVLSGETVSFAHRLLPGSAIQIIPGAPHSMYWEVPDLFNAALERSLNVLHGAV